MCEKQSMAKAMIQSCFIFSFLFLLCFKTEAQKHENWTPDQLMEPATLATEIGTKTNVPLIISVGPGETIPNSIHTGMASETAGLEALKQQLQNTPKDRKIVIYCGCCPFEHCPNARPAIDVLKEMKFTNYSLLNLQHNIKADWIDKGYPVAKQ